MYISLFRPGHRAHLLHVIDTSVKNTVTLTHLENQLSSALVLKSAEEYRFWMLAYVRYLSKEGKYLYSNLTLFNGTWYMFYNYNILF